MHCLLVWVHIGISIVMGTLRSIGFRLWMQLYTFSQLDDGSIRKWHELKFASILFMEIVTQKLRPVHIGSIARRYHFWIIISASAFRKFTGPLSKEQRNCCTFLLSSESTKKKNGGFVRTHNKLNERWLGTYFFSLICALQVLCMITSYYGVLCSSFHKHAKPDED